VNVSRNIIWSSSSGKRFLVTGFTSTVISYSVFIFISMFLETWIAFSISYILGLGWTASMTSCWVFKAKASGSKILIFIIMHTVIFTIGQLLIWIFSPEGFNEKLALSILIIGISAPISFFMGRYTFDRAGDNAKPQTSN